jgi:hypothetical protein
VRTGVREWGDVKPIRDRCIDRSRAGEAKERRVCSIVNKKGSTVLAREELTIVRDPSGWEHAISVVSVEELGLTAVEHPTFTPDELAAYADECEEGKHAIHLALSHLLSQHVDRRKATEILYEIAAWGGLSAYAEATQVHPGLPA